MNNQTLIIILLLFAACFTMNAQTSLCGSITSDSTLTLVNSPYTLTCDLVVEQGATLTIEPGVNIDFPSRDRDLIVKGKLMANGTVTDSIHFYGSGSYKGGSIAFLKAEAGSSISFVRIEELGVNSYSDYDAGLYLDSTTVAVSNSTFLNNTLGDVRATANSVGGFENTNALTAIRILNGMLTTSSSWPDADSDGFYYELLGDVTIQNAATLTIEPGANINFPSRDRDLIVMGKLMANGTTTDSIHFFGSGSYKGGSIAFLKAETGSSISFANIEELGVNSYSDFDAGLYLDSTTVAVSNSTFLNNAQGDVRATANSLGGFENTNSLTAIRILNGVLTTNSTWPDADSDGFYYELLGDVTVQNAVTLTIDPGASINFPYRDRDLIIKGKLIANGTATDSIHFYGTSSNKGGSIAFLKAETGSSISFARIEELGVSSYSEYDAGLYLDATTVAIGNTTFTGNTQGDVRATANSVAGFANTNSLLDIRITSDTLLTNATWPDADSSGFYYLPLKDLRVLNGNTLTIEPNVSVNFNNRDRDLIIEGSLIAEGTTTDSIHFLGIGSQGGGSLAFIKGDVGSSIKYTHIENLGAHPWSTYVAGLYLESTTVTVANNTFLGNTQGDVRATANSVAGFVNTNSLLDIRIISDTLLTNATWPDADSSGFYYLPLEDLRVLNGATLTVEPNVAVNFNNRYTDLIIEGNLIANGTSNDSIHFYGTGNDGGGSLAFIKANAGSSIQYTHIEKMGAHPWSAYNAGLYLDSTTIAVSNTTFVGNTQGDVRATANSVSGFENTNSLLDIRITSDTLLTNATWPDADSSGFYYLPLGDLRVLNGSTLTIEPNTAVNFNNRYTDLIIEGSLIANGTSNDSIHFYGTGNDGGGSVAFLSGSSGSILHASIDRLGLHPWSAHFAGIYAATSNLTIENCHIMRSIRGVSVDKYAEPSILNNTIKLNTNGIYVDFGFPTIEFNDILDNSSYGVWNNPANRIVEACNNYWGDPTGPYHPLLNPGGLGNAISDKVAAPVCLVLLNVKAFLEGPFNGTLMDDDLRLDSIIPVNQPYGGSPWDFPYTSRLYPDVLSVAGNDAIIDWVHLELRDSMDPTLVIAETVGLIQADGDIVEVDGVSPVGFITPSGSYYLVVDHRNHVSAMTALPVPVSGTTGPIVDFTVNAAYGFDGTKLLGGTYALFEGDASRDGNVNAADRSTIWNYRNYEDYRLQDTNLDGVCNAADRSNTWNNRNVESQVP